jgi:hypothetical protein
MQFHAVKIAGPNQVLPTVVLLVVIGGRNNNPIRAFQTVQNVFVGNIPSDRATLVKMRCGINPVSTRGADHPSDFGMATGTCFPIRRAGAADLCSK